jgi:hypothetical protein
MSKETLVFLCGIMLTVLPFLGIPQTWRDYGVFGTGVLLIFIGYAMRRAVYLRRIDRGDGERAGDAFVETTETLFDERTLK